MDKEKNYDLELIHKLQTTLEQNRDKRIVVVGTTCTGKSTFLKHIPSGVDMDEVLWPQLTDEEQAYADSDPWTPEVGEAVIRWTRERVKVEPSKPVFGTVVLPADLVIYLKISDDLLRQRTALREARFENAKNMQQQIEGEVRSSGIPVVEFPVG